RLRIGPDVPVALRVVARGPGLHEPRVLDARVVGHEIEQHRDLTPGRRRDQRVDVLERSQNRLDSRVVGDVVAPVGVGRDRDRVEPDAVDTQPCEMVEPLDDPPEVADAVAVRVGVRAWVDLVEDAFFPPTVRVVTHGRGAYVPQEWSRRRRGWSWR